MKSPTIEKALNNLKSESDPQKLVQIFKQSAEERRFCRLRAVYEATVKQLAFAKQFDVIEEILDHSLQVREPCSDSFINRIVMLYVVAGTPQHAIKTFNQIKSLNISPAVKSFNTLLDALIESKNPKLAHDFYRGIDSLDVSANLKSYNIVVKAICEMNERESAYSFLDEMRKHGCKPDTSTDNTILWALYKQGKHKEADDLLDKMSGSFPPDVRTYNIRMRNLCGCHKTSDAEKILDEMVSKGLNLNIIHFNTHIAGFYRDNNMTETKMIFSDISRKGCVQGAVTYSTFIYFLSKGGHFDRACEFCMLKNLMPNVKIAKMLIDALQKTIRLKMSMR